MKKIRQILRDLGLEEKEISLYLSALTLGDAGMSQIAAKAGLKRSTAYLIFESLEHKGLMGSYKMRDGLKFVATKPEILVSKATQNLEALQTIVPQLHGLSYKSDQRPQITYYEGKEGYVVAAEDSLKTPNSTIYHIGSFAEFDSINGIEYEENHYIPGRINKRISLQCLYFKSEMASWIQQRDDAKDLREIRFLPEEYKHNTSTLIYGNKVAIFSAKQELITIIVESADIAASEREKFELLWSLVGKTT